MLLLNDKVQEELKLIKELKGIGGPTNPLEWFYNVSHLQFNLTEMAEVAAKQNLASLPSKKLTPDEQTKLNEHCSEYVESLFPILHQMYTVKVPQLLKAQGIDITKSDKFAKGTMYLIYLYEEGRKAQNIDDILCLYLIDIAEKVLVNFYKLAACFIQLFRNCLN